VKYEDVSLHDIYNEFALTVGSVRRKGGRAGVIIVRLSPVFCLIDRTIDFS